MALTHVPEDTKIARAAALLFVVGLVALIGGASLGGVMNRGSPPGTPWPGVVYPLFLIGVAAIIAGVAAFIVYVRRESGDLQNLKDKERKG